MNQRSLAFQLLDENMEPVSATFSGFFAQSKTGEWRNMSPVQIPIRGAPYLVRAHDDSELEEYWSEPLGRLMKDEEPRDYAQFTQGALALRMRV
jgi:ethanolamine utilization protein EutA (predicted chaperonin)